MAHKRTRQRPWYHQVVGIADANGHTYSQESDRSVVYDKLEWHHPDGDFKRKEDVYDFFQGMMDLLASRGFLTDLGKTQQEVDSDDFQLTSPMLTVKGQRFMETEYPLYIRQAIKSQQGEEEVVLESVAGVRHYLVDPIGHCVLFVPFWLLKIAKEKNWDYQDLVDHRCLAQLSARDLMAYRAAQTPRLIESHVKLKLDWKRLADLPLLSPEIYQEELVTEKPNDIFLGVSDPSRNDIGFQYVDSFYKGERLYHVVAAMPCANAQDYNPEELHHALAEQLYAQIPDVSLLTALGFLGPSYRSVPETSIV